ncbi:hypothetical protein MRB53_022928 [Persea americana]|uniref:Uncharacterized protein n=1 Tax=Persea americana TaxID=3435 RepID=A0ACC2L8C8_PERAE|nr:hypothetical protein MRB53_022928 [Persea americana]
MAEGVVTLFLNKLSELIERETHLLGGVSQDVRLLREKFQRISLFLKEADDKCLQDKEVKLWVAQEMPLSKPKTLSRNLFSKLSSLVEELASYIS